METDTTKRPCIGADMAQERPDGAQALSSEARQDTAAAITAAALNPAARPIVIESWSLGDRFTMTIIPRAQPVMAIYRCQINDVEVPGPVFELALRLVMGGSR